MEITNPIMEVLVIILVAAAVIAGAFVLLPRLTKQGKDISGAIRTGDLIVDCLYTVNDTLKAIFPKSGAWNVADKILDYANRAVEAAEQMYKTSQIPKDERKPAAAQLVYQFLETAGVEVTEELWPIVDGAIEAAVHTLPKTHQESAGSTENTVE